ncbi:MAG: GNAT family N-acetyltransferase [Candidatus Diapherotrites archaeon]|nr:GNAT family N-acetyltransferase [Candidatus Diapherotrites archaeon]
MPEVFLNTIGEKIGNETVTEQTILSLLERDESGFVAGNRDRLQQLGIVHFVIANKDDQKVGVISLGLKNIHAKVFFRTLKEMYKEFNPMKWVLGITFLMQLPFFMKNKGAAYNMLIMPEFQKKGYGKEAVKELEEKAKQEGIKILRASVRRKNPKMRKLLRDLGWKVDVPQTVKIFPVSGRKKDIVYKKRVK